VPTHGKKEEGDPCERRSLLGIHRDDSCQDEKSPEMGEATAVWKAFVSAKGGNAKKNFLSKPQGKRATDGQKGGIDYSCHREKLEREQGRIKVLGGL